MNVLKPFLLAASLFSMTLSPALAIVTANPATADPSLPDPHLVNGPFDPNDPLPLQLPERPPIDPSAIIELLFDLDDGSTGTCTASVIETPQHAQLPAGHGVLTAAHCAKDLRVKKITTEIVIGGSATTFETCDEANVGCDLDDFVFVHPLYNTDVKWGYDLAIVYFEDVIPTSSMAYDVSQDAMDPYGSRFFVKFGYGCFGYGGDGVDTSDPAVFDHQLRWAMNVWDSEGLGTFGVRVCDRAIARSNVQLTLDLDNYSHITNNLFNFYGNTFDPSTAYIEANLSNFYQGVTGSEGWGCAGDSGGPNFVYDTAIDQWTIRAVSSYVRRIDDDYNGFTGNSDITSAAVCGAFDYSFGEFESDALVTQDLIDQVLGIAVPGPGGGPRGSNPASDNGMGMAPGPSGPSPSFN